MTHVPHLQAPEQGNVLQVGSSACQKATRRVDAAGVEPVGKFATLQAWMFE